MSTSRTFALFLLLAAPAAAQTATKLSVSPSGGAGNGNSSLVELKECLSPDGRFELFVSSASNLVANDLNGLDDVFVRDSLLGTTTLASLTSAGTQPNAHSLGGAISDDGRFVAFQSTASNVVAGDTNGTIDVFLRDRQAATTVLVSVSLGGGAGNNSSASPSISSDGSRVAFVSAANDLVAGDTNGVADVFVRDLTSGTTWLVSKLPSGTLSNGQSTRPMLSGDGQLVAFNSAATNFVGPHPIPGALRVILSAVPTGFVEEVSVNSAGQSSNGTNSLESISRDGQRLLFQSGASNLGPVFLPLSSLFLRDRANGATTLVTRLANGSPANGQASSASISSNGQFALFASTSTDLTAGHTVGGYDAFAMHLDSRAVVRLSVPSPFPGEPNQGGVDNVGEISDDGLRATFSATSTNLVQGDTLDTTRDIFEAVWNGQWFADSDADGYGDPNVATTQLPPPAGFVSVAGDCNDANDAIHPGAVDICNGIDDDCDGVFDPNYTVYCVAPPSVQGCDTQVSATGTPSVSSSSGYVLHATSLPGQKNGLFIYSTSADFLIYANGNQSRICVGAPRVRMTTLPTGGNAGACDGSLSIDWLAWMSANPGAVGHPLHVGQTFYAQAWYRDAFVAGTSNLTRGLQFSICP